MSVWLFFFFRRTYLWVSHVLLVLSESMGFLPPLLSSLCQAQVHWAAKFGCTRKEASGTWHGDGGRTDAPLQESGLISFWVAMALAEPSPTRFFSGEMVTNGNEDGQLAAGTSECGSSKAGCERKWWIRLRMEAASVAFIKT